jgi:hypothetical protein
VTPNELKQPPDGGGGRSPLRLAAIVGALVVPLVAVFGLAQAFGGGSPPAGAPTKSLTGDAHGHGHAPGTQPKHPHGGFTIGDAVVGGLAASAGGYTFTPASTTPRAGAPAPFRFRIDGPDGRPVTRFATAHGRPMHLVVVRRDLSGYRHLHPRMAADGTWQTDLALPAPGTWRGLADFAALAATGAKAAVSLGVDLRVAGRSSTTPLPAPAREATVDRYTVTYEGTPQAGVIKPLVFRVFKGGEPVLDLGAYGHLVALRERDLGYVYVHAEKQLFRGAAKFWLSAPSRGRYRMFFDFKVGERMHTAAFTVPVS